jgi:uncharacterized protein
MTGIENLELLLRTIDPILNSKLYVICCLQGKLSEYAHLDPVASCVESEGLTLILEKQQADSHAFHYEQIYQQITLSVHSSLQAVGLTAAFSKKLTEHNISANVVAGYYHDHIFVQTEVAEQAIVALEELQRQN